MDRVLDVAVTTDTESGEVGGGESKTPEGRGRGLGSADVARDSFCVVGGDPLPGQVVQPLLRGGDVGAAGGFRPGEDQGV